MVIQSIGTGSKIIVDRTTTVRALRIRILYLESVHLETIMKEQTTGMAGTKGSSKASKEIINIHDSRTTETIEVGMRVTDPLMIRVRRHSIRTGSITLNINVKITVLKLIRAAITEVISKIISNHLPKQQATRATTSGSTPKVRSSLSQSHCPSCKAKGTSSLPLSKRPCCTSRSRLEDPPSFLVC
jgi:hypothetical protein